MSTSAKRRRKRKKQRVRKMNRTRQNKADQAAQEMRWDDEEDDPDRFVASMTGRMSASKPNLQNVPPGGYSGSFSMKLTSDTALAFAMARRAMKHAEANMAVALKKFKESE